MKRAIRNWAKDYLLALAIAAAGLITIAGTPAHATPAGEDESAMPSAPGMPKHVEPFPLGAQIYAQQCAACHDVGIGRAPQKIVLQFMDPEAIKEALTSGSMRAQGAALNEERKIAVAQYLSGRKIGQRDNSASVQMCDAERAAFDRGQTPAFAAWGFDERGTHSIASETAGIGRENAARLKLKWAFGFPGAIRARSQPAIGGGAIFVGSQSGDVYALDRETGCVRWQFKAAAEVRTGIVLEGWEADDEGADPLAFFGDFAGNAYAVKAFTGELAWKVDADLHPAAVVTGTPTLHDGLLYVPVSSLEEASAASPRYSCCTFRGSILALDAETGEEVWRTYLVGKPEQQPAGEGETVFFGPSGVAVWNAPAVDEKRGLLYVTTGDNYTNPTTELSDAIVAFDLKSGEIRWHYQATEGDAWNVACVTPAPTNCPEDAGPDYDFGAAAVLANSGDGREFLLAGQKSGIAYGLDPDTGKLVWQERLGRGGAAGGIHFGIAASDGRLYAPVSDLPDGSESEFPLSPGIYALDIATGKRLWDAPAPNPCEGRKACVPGYGSAISATSELVFAGSDDGFMRIYDAASGELVWDFDTARSFETVNGVEAHGGAISGGAAPIALGGQLLVLSGYGFASKMPGNVLLVFGAE